MINSTLIHPLMAMSNGYSMAQNLGTFSGVRNIRVNFSEAQPAQSLARAFMIEAMDLIGLGRLGQIETWVFKHHFEENPARLPPFEVDDAAILAYQNPGFDRKRFANEAAGLMRRSLLDGSPDYRPDYVVIDGPCYWTSRQEAASNLHQMRIAWREFSEGFLTAIRVNWPRSEDEGRSPFLPFIGGLMTLLTEGRN